LHDGTFNADLFQAAQGDKRGDCVGKYFFPGQDKAGGQHYGILFGNPDVDKLRRHVSAEPVQRWCAHVRADDNNIRVFSGKIINLVPEDVSLRIVIHGGPFFLALFCKHRHPCLSAPYRAIGVHLQ